MHKEDVFLEVHNIKKSFPGVLALDNVDLIVKKGTILALVGENGAGKSTLMKILSGVHSPDEGEILIEGRPVKIENPNVSQGCGISIIYQELNLIPNMNIAENIFIGKEPRKKGFVDKALMHKRATELINKVGLTVSTKTPVGKLSAAQKQMIEVAKAISSSVKLIVMDEPTSSLTEKETQKLYEIMRTLKEQQVAVIFITHRMKEIFQISDEIAVMRDGKMITTIPTKDTNEAQVISHMVGREINDIFAKEPTEIGEIALEVKNLCTRDFLKDVSFFVRRGEIVGFAGLVGAGRSEVMRAVFGIDRITSGEILIHNENVRIRKTEDAFKLNMGFVPEDRKEQALILSMSVKNNITLAALLSFRKRLFIDSTMESEVTEKYIQQLQIRTPGEDQLVMNLSGGNQQKVVIGKWMETKPEIMIMDEPTRGTDVNTKKEIHLLMSRLAKSGVAIIMISSEMPEIIGMSDRIIVMAGGRITGELNRDECSQEKIMKMAIS